MMVPSQSENGLTPAIRRGPFHRPRLPLQKARDAANVIAARLQKDREEKLKEELIQKQALEQLRVENNKRHLEYDLHMPHSWRNHCRTCLIDGWHRTHCPRCPCYYCNSPHHLGIQCPKDSLIKSGKPYSWQLRPYTLAGAPSLVNVPEPLTQNKIAATTDQHISPGGPPQDKSGGNTEQYTAVVVSHRKKRNRRLAQNNSNLPGPRVSRRLALAAESFRAPGNDDLVDWRFYVRIFMLCY
jgi:hypothetical protein